MQFYSLNPQIFTPIQLKDIWMLHQIIFFQNGKIHKILHLTATSGPCKVMDMIKFLFNITYGLSP